MTLQYRNCDSALLRTTSGPLACECCCGSEPSHCCGCQTVRAEFSNKTVLSLDEPGVDGSELDHLLAGFLLDTRGHFPPDQTGTGWCMWDFTGDQDGRPLVELVHTYHLSLGGVDASFICETWSTNDITTWELWTSDPVLLSWTGSNCWPLVFTVTMRLGGAAIRFDVRLDCDD